MAEIFNCPTCGGPLEYAQGAEITIRCPYCHNTVIVPDELRSSLGSGGTISTGDRSKPLALAVPSIDPQKVEQEIRELLAARQKINAIKVYRQVTGAGLKDAKEAVEAIEAGGKLDASRLTTQVNLTSSPADEASIIAQASLLVREGNKIAAIRLLRSHYDVSLKVAKNAADQLEKGQSVNMEWLKIQASQAVSPYVKPFVESERRDFRGFLFWACLSGILLILILFFLVKF